MRFYISANLTICAQCWLSRFVTTWPGPQILSLLVIPMTRTMTPDLEISLGKHFVCRVYRLFIKHSSSPRFIFFIDCFYVFSEFLLLTLTGFTSWILACTLISFSSNHWWCLENYYSSTKVLGLVLLQNRIFCQTKHPIVSNNTFVTCSGKRLLSNILI